MVWNLLITIHFYVNQKICYKKANFQILDGNFLSSLFNIPYCYVNNITLTPKRTEYLLIVILNSNRKQLTLINGLPKITNRKQITNFLLSGRELIQCWTWLWCPGFVSVWHMYWCLQIAELSHSVSSPMSFRVEYRRGNAGAAMFQRQVRFQVDLSTVSKPSCPKEYLYAVTFTLLSGNVMATTQHFFTPPFQHQCFPGWVLQRWGDVGAVCLGLAGFT